MTLKVYKFDALVQAAKAIARGIPGIGTEPSKDLDLSINAAARLLFGVQVAAANIYAQLVPADADATRRDELAEDLGLTFERDACPARGLIAVTYSIGTIGSFKLLAGTELTFPAALFPDGQERTYRLLQDVMHGAYDVPGTPMAIGTGIHKLLPKSADGAVPYSPRDLLILKSDAGAGTRYAVVRTANTDDQSLDLYTSVQGAMDSTAGNEIDQYVHTAVVEAECTTAGAAGNAPRVYLALEDYPTFSSNGLTATTGDLRVMLVEMSGGGDAQGAADNDVARQVRLIEDTIACPPGHGNLQHLRELALSCPDVDLDDAVVYQHVRGPGSIDIVCIGRSGSVQSSAFPGAHLAYVFGGNNQRVIGDVQAQRVQAWVQSQLDYYADLRVRSMEWDWRGSVYRDNSLESFVQSSSGIAVGIVPRDGYGPDCGVAIDVVPWLRSATQLFSVANGTPVDASLQPGQRVWVAVGPSTANERHAFATVVTTILSVARDRSYVTVASLKSLCPGLDATYGGTLAALRWGSAGPLTQPVLDAAFAYFDQLGPGSYIGVPRGPRYARMTGHSGIARPGYGVTRWPSESRRWSSCVRESEMDARFLQIPGVNQTAIVPVIGTVPSPDFEPTIFKTCALTGCVARYL